MDADLTVIPDDLLAGLIDKAERSLAQCERLRFGFGDAGIMLWHDARNNVRALHAESIRRVSVELDAFNA